MLAMFRTEQLHLDVVAIGGSHDDVCVDAFLGSVVAGHGHASRAAILDDDSRDSRTGDQACSRRLGKGRDAVDDSGESALRVEHAVVHIEVTHQVVHARYLQGRAAEEDRRISEQPTQPRILRPGSDVGVKRASEKAGEAWQSPQYLGVEERPHAVKRGVEEAAQCELVRRGRGVEIALELVGGSGVQCRHGGAGRLATSREVKGLRDAFKVGTVAGIEPFQSELRFGRGAEHPIEVVENLRHEVPGRAGIEAESLGAPRSGTTAEFLTSFQQYNPMPVAGQQRGRRDPCDAAADHNDLVSAHARTGRSM